MVGFVAVTHDGNETWSSVTEQTIRPAKVLVYGSCVARDTLEFADPASFDLGRYVARQSLISVGSDASAHLPDDLQVASAFQGRMIRGDFAGSLTGRLAEQAEGADLLLWDLADERHGVHRFSDGTIATRSIDTIKMPQIAERFAAAEHVPFGSAEHLELWKRAARPFGEFLESVGLRERIVVLDVPWARITAEGKPSPWSMGVRAGEANERYRPYYEHLRSLGYPSIRLPQEVVVADPSHRWGLAPFHYIPEVYLEVLRILAERHGTDLRPAHDTAS